MHISESVLSVPVLVAGGGLSAIGVGVGLWRMQERTIPRVGMLAGVLFVTSLVHVPIGPTSAHLLGVGLAGALLGWSIFPALLVACLLQALLFGYGGLTTLGVTVACFGVAGLACRVVVLLGLRNGRPDSLSLAICGAMAGAIGVAGSCAMIAAALMYSDQAFAHTVALLLGGHVPVLVAESLVTAAVLVAVGRTQPRLLIVPKPVSAPA